ncbi:MAG: fumarylacetoacetate hydrolase family protein [Sneathiella sp.]
MPYLFPPAPIPTLPIIGRSESFPVRRIFCVGRNYAEHSREMGGDPEREAPFFFSKPADALVQNNCTLPFPQATQNLHFEMELVLAIGKKGQNIAPSDADDYLFGYASGIDLTRRDLQAEAKEKGRPWDTAKGFDQSAPCSAITERLAIPDIEQARISLEVNKDLKQDAKLSDMIWSPLEIICSLSSFYTLMPGDLIYTGTPAGVSQILPGDMLEGHIEGLPTIAVTFR